MKNCNINYHKSKAMTLVEVLVTVFILLMIFAFSFKSLSTMISTREAVPQEIFRINDLERVFDRIENDFLNVSLISPISPDGNRLYPIMVGKNGALAEITFSRLASEDYQNEDGQLVGYRLNKGVLEILIWQTLYLASASKVATAKVYPLLEEVESFSVAIKNSNRENWETVYPKLQPKIDAIGINQRQNQIKTLPIGLKIEIKVKKIPGTLTRIVNRLY